MSAGIDTISFSPNQSVIQQKCDLFCSKIEDNSPLAQGVAAFCQAAVNHQYSAMTRLGGLLVQQAQEINRDPAVQEQEKTAGAVEAHVLGILQEMTPVLEILGRAYQKLELEAVKIAIRRNPNFSPMEISLAIPEARKSIQNLHIIEALALHLDEFNQAAAGNDRAQAIAIAAKIRAFKPSISSDMPQTNAFYSLCEKRIEILNADNDWGQLKTGFLLLGGFLAFIFLIPPAISACTQLGARGLEAMGLPKQEVLNAGLSYYLISGLYSAYQAARTKKAASFIFSVFMFDQARRMAMLADPALLRA